MMMEKQTQQTNQTMETLSHTAQLLAQTVATMGKKQKEEVERQQRDSEKKIRAMMEMQKEAMSQMMEMKGGGSSNTNTPPGSEGNSPVRTPTEQSGSGSKRKRTLSNIPVLTWNPLDVSAWLSSKVSPGRCARAPHTHTHLWPRT